MTKEINDLQDKILAFDEELKSFLEVYEDGEVENAFEKLTMFSNKKHEYSKHLHYLKTLKFVVDAKYVILKKIPDVARFKTSNERNVCSSDIKKSYRENSWSKCLPFYLDLCSLLHEVNKSQCSNLVNYLKGVIQYWHKLLKIKLTE